MSSTPPLLPPGDCDGGSLPFTRDLPPGSQSPPASVLSLDFPAPPSVGPTDASSCTLHDNDADDEMTDYFPLRDDDDILDHQQQQLHHIWGLLSPMQHDIRMAYHGMLANLHSMSQAMLAADIPSYISARSANSIISESRPTRIQAETLSFLNRILDELLLFIVASSRSLATDRIKTDGLLRVLNNNPLSKDAVLEAELELRQYLQGKKAEGGRVPLGLSATSRWDGTEAFPVASAYAALRTRCQYYSTLGDREDDSVTNDQHIMSSEGRPIATITPGVSIYVTALLEYVGEYILKNVARVIERDNSDEASIADLKAAIEEDEQMITMWRQMVVKQELEKRIVAIIAHDGGAKRITRPWKVPDADELDEAATPARFRGSRTPRPGTGGGPPPGWSSIDRGGSSVSGHGHTASESVHMNESHSGNSISVSSSRGGRSGSLSQSPNVTSPSSEAPPTGTTTPAMTRRGSVDKGLSGFFSNRRRGSFRSSQDISGGPPLKGGSASVDAGKSPENGEPIDDFEALMMSGQTMRVSLTPNRLRTIEVARQEAEAKKARQRPGTLNVANLKNELADSGVSPRAATASPVPGDPRPSSRASYVPTPSPGGPRRAATKISNPPSSYRGPDTSNPSVGPSAAPYTAGDGLDDESHDAVPGCSIGRTRKNASAGPLPAVKQEAKKLEAREKRASWATRDVMDLLNSTPPSPHQAGQFPGTNPSGTIKEGRASTASHASSMEGMGSLGKKGPGVGGKMRALLGRRSISGKESPALSLRHEERPSTGSGNGSYQNDAAKWQSAQDEVYDEEAASSHGHSGVDPAQAEPDTHSSSHGDVYEEVPSGAARVQSPESLRPPSRSQSRLAQSFVDGPNSQDRTPVPRYDEADAPVHQSSTPAPNARTSTSSGRGGLVGLYDDHSIGSAAGGALGVPLASPSALEGSRPEGPPSRKIPYGRRASRDGAGFGSGAIGDRVRSNRSSDGAVQSSVERSSSALGYNTPGRSPVTASYMASRSVNGPFPFASTPAASPTTANNNSGNNWSPLSWLHLLSGLDRQMKHCSTVEECRALVHEAIGAARRDASLEGAGMPNGNGRSETPMTSLTDPDDASIDPRNVPLRGSYGSRVNGYSAHEKATTKPAHPILAPVFTAPPPRKVPQLVMSDLYNPDEDENSPSFQQSGYVAGWLLEDCSSSPSGSSPADIDEGRFARTHGSASHGASAMTPAISSSSHLTLPSAASPSTSTSLSYQQSAAARARKISTGTTNDFYASADEGDIEDGDGDVDVDGSRDGHGEIDDAGYALDSSSAATDDANVNASPETQRRALGGSLTPIVGAGGFVRNSVAMMNAVSGGGAAAPTKERHRPPPSASGAAIRASSRTGSV